MKIVSDSSPLITLAKIKRLELLPQLYQTVLITPEVYDEVAVTGAGLPGAAEMVGANWLEVHALHEKELSKEMHESVNLGLGEWSTILLALELKADAVLMDDRRGRRAAWARGVDTIGCIGVLEEAFDLKLIPDLRAVYLDLLKSGTFVSLDLLQASLRKLNLSLLE